jgi:hypothetical protein
MSTDQIEAFTAASHNGTITCTNPASGESRTFRIRTQPDDSSFAPGKRVLSLLTGPDNTSDYTGFAFVEGNRVQVWRSKLGTKFEAYARFIERLDYHRDHHGIEVYWAALCRRCNRQLTTVDSIRSGIGPTCAGRES